MDLRNLIQNQYSFWQTDSSIRHRRLRLRIRRLWAKAGLITVYIEMEVAAIWVYIDFNVSSFMIWKVSSSWQKRICLFYTPFWSNLLHTLGWTHNDLLGKESACFLQPPSALYTPAECMWTQLKKVKAGNHNRCLSIGGRFAARVRRVSIAHLRLGLVTLSVRRLRSPGDYKIQLIDVLPSVAWSRFGCFFSCRGSGVNGSFGVCLAGFSFLCNFIVLWFKRFGAIRLCACVQSQMLIIVKLFNRNARAGRLSIWNNGNALWTIGCFRWRDSGRSQVHGDVPSVRWQSCTVCSL